MRESLRAGVTAGALLATDLRHAPACATTLIVALGLLSTPREGALMLAAVVVLVAVHRLSSLLAPTRRLAT